MENKRRLTVVKIKNEIPHLKMPVLICEAVVTTVTVVVPLNTVMPTSELRPNRALPGTGVRVHSQEH